VKQRSVEHSGPRTADENPGRAPTEEIGRQFAAFLVVGTAGFVVDASLFLLFTIRYRWTIAAARTLSFCCAIAATWALNRSLTFAKQRSRHPAGEFLHYAAVQLGGVAINAGVFALAIWSSAAIRRMPIIALVLGSGVALVFNFTAARALVFRGSKPR
jgi:putative flippase GtrA